MSQKVSKNDEITLNNLINRYNTLSTIKKRAINAIVGGAVGDAACQPLNWIYDLAHLNHVINHDSQANLGFWLTSESPFTIMATGSRTNYNDLGYVMMISMLLSQSTSSTPSTHENVFNKSIYYQKLSEFFSKDSLYRKSYLLRLEVYGQGLKQPIEGPWQLSDVTTLITGLENNEIDPTGSLTSVESTGFTSTLPLISKVACIVKIDDASDVKTGLQVIQSAAAIITPNPVLSCYNLAVSWILIQCIQSDEFDVSYEALESLIKSLPSDLLTTEFLSMIETSLQDIQQAVNESTQYPDSVHRFGKGCDNPGWFKSVLLAIILDTNDENGGYVQGIDRTIRAGGGSSSRANFVGSFLGAKYGFQTDDNEKGIPLSWILQTDKGLEIFENALNLIDVE